MQKKNNLNFGIHWFWWSRWTHTPVSVNQPLCWVQSEQVNDFRRSDVFITVDLWKLNVSMETTKSSLINQTLTEISLAPLFCSLLVYVVIMLMYICQNRRFLFVSWTCSWILFFSMDRKLSNIHFNQKTLCSFLLFLCLFYEQTQENMKTWFLTNLLDSLNALLFTHQWKCAKSQCLRWC